MSDIEDIKAKVDIVNFISEYISLKKSGRNFKACCPFHNEKTPSFYVSAERQSWHCFGACNEGGDVISFLQKWESIEFLEALKILAKRANVILTNYQPDDTTRLKDKLYAINHLAGEFYHYILTRHKIGQKALNYLKERHIKDQTIKTFLIGYAPLSWDSVSKYLKKKGYEEEDIHTAGITVRSDRGTYYDRFRGRLMFALRDHRGNTVGFSGRKLPSSQPADKEAKYINTSETPIYIKGNTLYGLDITKEAIKKEKEAIVVEGEFDFLSSFQSGVANVVAIKGSALTEGQILLLKRYTEDVILALDSDFAGNEAAKRGLEIAENSGLSVRIARLLFGKDPAECVEKDPVLWQKSVKKPVPVYDFVIENAVSKYGSGDALSKKKVSAEVVPFLSGIINPIILSHYIKYLAKILDVSEEGVEQAIGQHKKKQKPLIEAVQTVSAKNLRVNLLEDYFLTLIIQSPKPPVTLGKIETLVGPDDFSQPVQKKIFEFLVLFFKKHDVLDFQLFSSQLTPELVSIFNTLCLRDIENVLEKDKIFDKELKITAVEIKKISLRRRINDISTNIKQHEENMKEEEVESLQQEMQKSLVILKELTKST